MLTVRSDENAFVAAQRGPNRYHTLPLLEFLM